MTTREILENARDLIRDEEHWCQGKAIDGRATQGCLWTAVNAAVSGLNFREFLGGIPGTRRQTVSSEGMMWLLSVYANRLDPHSLGGAIQFNDTHTHAEVLELFNLVIADEIAREDVHTRHMAEEQERELAEDPAAPLVFA